MTKTHTRVTTSRVNKPQGHTVLTSLTPYYILSIRAPRTENFLWITDTSKRHNLTVKVVRNICGFKRRLCVVERSNSKTGLYKKLTNTVL